MEILLSVCVGIVGLILLGLLLRWFVRWQRRTNDPLWALRGKSREEIHQILHTPIYRPPQEQPSKRKSKSIHREP